MFWIRRLVVLFGMAVLMLAMTMLQHFFIKDGDELWWRLLMIAGPLFLMVIGTLAGYKWIMEQDEKYNDRPISLLDDEDDDDRPRRFGRGDYRPQ